ncbi:MAG: VPLPA-CTERM sorting domain-containing protein [Pseudomonadota bacterium]
MSSRLLSLSLLLLPAPALASTLTVAFTYEVQFVSPIGFAPSGTFDPQLKALSAGFTPGSTYTANYTYALGQPDQNPDPLSGEYALQSGQVNLPSSQFPAGSPARTEFTVEPSFGAPVPLSTVAMSLGYDGTGAATGVNYTMTTVTLDNSLLGFPGGGVPIPPPPTELTTLGDSLPDEDFWNSFPEAPLAPGLTIKDYLVGNLVISLDDCDPLVSACAFDRQATVISYVTDINVTVDQVTPVPLPATLPLSLAAFGGGALVLRRRKLA